MDIASYSNTERVGIAKRNMGKKELCRWEYTLRNLTHDVNIEYVKVDKG